MEIQGPFSISINDNHDSGTRELHLGFKPAFQQLPLAERIDSIKSHLNELEQNIRMTTNNADQQGMTTIYQVISELLPYLESDQIPLEETIVIEIGPSQSSPLDDLLRGATLK